MTKVLQRFASLDRLNMHVVYNSKRLIEVHERAGFETIAAGYIGFYDGFVSATEAHTAPLRAKRMQRYVGPPTWQTRPGRALPGNDSRRTRSGSRHTSIT